MKVLYIEDNEVNRLLVRDILTRLHVEFFEADNGYEGIDLAVAHQPDVILMDIRMPKFNGIEATRELKANPDTAHIPVVMLTADVTPIVWQEARQVGCEAFLPKPINLPALLMVLNQVTQDRFKDRLILPKARPKI